RRARPPAARRARAPLAAAGVADPRRRAALEAAACPRPHARLRGAAQAPRASRRSDGAAARLHPAPLVSLHLARRRGALVARHAGYRVGADRPCRPPRALAPLRVGPLPGAHALAPALASVPGAVAQPSPAPLQERALLVRRHAPVRRPL